MRSLRRSNEPGAVVDLFDANWVVLTDAVMAAHRGDRRRFLAQLSRFETEVPVDRHAQIQTWIVLGAFVGRHIGKCPPTQAVSELIRTIRPRVRVLVGDDFGSIGALTDTVLFALDQRSGADVAAGEFVVTGLAASGVLSKDPATELIAMRRPAQNWVAKHFPDKV
jgi:hypothetical protein